MLTNIVAAKSVTGWAQELAHQVSQVIAMRIPNISTHTQTHTVYRHASIMLA